MNRNDKDLRNSIPQNDPSKAMDSKKEVERSNDAKIDQDFPGYPHYPSREDIMDQRTGNHQVDMNVEELQSGRNATGVSQRFAASGRDNDEATNEEEIGNDNTERKGGSPMNDDSLLVLDAMESEIGVPQNVSNEDLQNEDSLPGTDIDEEENQSGRKDRGQ